MLQSLSGIRTIKYYYIAGISEARIQLIKFGAATPVKSLQHSEMLEYSMVLKSV